MKNIFLVFTFALSSLAYAQVGQRCLSHGQCQNITPVEKVACFKVLTGTDPLGNVTCAIRCQTILAGAYCSRRLHSPVGVCKIERFREPSFDPNSPDCSGAIDPIL